MHSIRKTHRIVNIPQGYEKPDDGAYISPDDTNSIISDTGDYPEEHSEVEYISEYELEDSNPTKCESETDNETDNESELVKYKNLESILTEEDDFAEIKFYT